MIVMISADRNNHNNPSGPPVRFYFLTNSFPVE